MYRTQLDGMKRTMAFYCFISPTFSYSQSYLKSPFIPKSTILIGPKIYNSILIGPFSITIQSNHACLDYELAVFTLHCVLKYNILCIL